MRNDSNEEDLHENRDYTTDSKPHGGPHRCAGEPLARLMLQVTMEKFLQRTAKIELDGEVKMTRWPEWGALSVPLKISV